MTQQYPKRLIEVDLPIRRISAHARREKSIRHGHISTLHIWWARRPLAACRAVICASLWPDPADALCPQSFRDRATRIIYEFACAAAGSKEIGENCDHETWLKWQSMAKKGALDSHNEAHWNTLRFTLLDFIADFANWDNSTVKEYLDTGRALTQAAHEALGGEPGTHPLVVDPFAGGGSIPLESLRVGADAFASDLNPIPVLLNKVILEYIPRYGDLLSTKVAHWASVLKNAVQDRLDEVYPCTADGNTPIAYIWARTIHCEGPGCGVEYPLLRSLHLAQKEKRSVALRLIPNHADKTVGVDIVERNNTKKNSKWTSQLGDQISDFSPQDFGTVKRGSATCPLCGYTTPVSSVRAQLRARKGGTLDARLLVVVSSNRNASGRSYTLPDDDQIFAVKRAGDALDKLRSSPNSFKLPEEAIDPSEPRRIPLPLYGMDHWSELFNARQLYSLGTYINELQNLKIDEPDQDLHNAIRIVLSLSVSKLADRNSSLCRWISQNQSPGYTFGRQALPMLWDFVETVPSESGGGWDGVIADTCEMIRVQSTIKRSGQSTCASATSQILPDHSVDCVFTDPPYYYSIPYANLSDFFYVWLKKMLAELFPTLFDSKLTKKSEEAIQNLPHKEVAHLQKDRNFYERTMTLALAQGAKITKPSGLACVVFAHTETEAWESLLTALVTAGWCVTASWPVDTERAARIIAQRQSTLASSVHLICRPRSTNDPEGADSVGEWRQVLQELPRRIHEWMPRLADEGVVGADAIFACLGPALEIFSRYDRVEKANGDTVTLRQYLEHVWAAVAKEALAQVFQGVDTSGFEPDARLTAMWLWTLNAPVPNSKDEEADEEDADDEESETKKPKITGFKLEYDAARKIAQGLGAALENLTHLVQVKGDEARLLAVAERTRFLFGKDQEEPTRAARKKAEAQINMFAELTEAEDADTVWHEKTVSRLGETTLDRVHQAMILFAAGRGEALKRFIVDDGVGQDSKFWRLAQALSALYPTGTEERRWVEGVMARKRQFGF